MTPLSNLPRDEVQRMLDFARQWYPYGGGSADDILVEFGLGERDYFERLTDALDTDQAGGHDQSVVAAIRQVCTRRLA